MAQCTPCELTTPLSVYLPFNRECLGATFVARQARRKPPEPVGHWLLVQDQRLIVVPDGAGLRLPHGTIPDGLGDARVEPDSGSARSMGPSAG